jgi:hypothetical protein
MIGAIAALVVVAGTGLVVWIATGRDTIARGLAEIDRTRR